MTALAENCAVLKNLHVSGNKLTTPGKNKVRSSAAAVIITDTPNKLPQVTSKPKIKSPFFKNEANQDTTEDT